MLGCNYKVQSTPSDIMDLRRYADQHLLVTFATRGDIWDYKKQHSLFSGRGDDMRAHDLALLKFFEQKPSLAQEEPLSREAYDEAIAMFDVDRDTLGEFYVMLITRDGRVLLDSNEPVDPDQVFRALARYDHEPQIEGL